jgi:Protein of unknown function (DUF2971)
VVSHNTFNLGEVHAVAKSPEELSQVQREKRKEVAEKLRDALLSDWKPRHSAPPPILYHYTTADGLVGIVHGRTLNATHSNFLNDPQEVSFAEEILRSFLKQRRSAFGASDAAKALFYDSLIDSLEKVRSSRELYVASLSEADDLLSQWQSYSSRGYGYSVGFDGHALRDIYGSPGIIYLRRVFYSAFERDYSLNRMAEDAERLIDGLFSQWGESLVPSMMGLVEIVADLLEEFLVTFKHEAFTDEKEWRVCVVRTSDPLRSSPLPVVGFRVGGSRLVPYMPIQLGGGDRPNPIKSIRVGPALDPINDSGVIRMLLEREGLSGVTVGTSRIRLR